MMSQTHRRAPGLVGLAFATVLATPVPAAADRHAPQILIGVTFATVSYDVTQEFGVDWRRGLTAGVDFSVPVAKESQVSFHPEVLVTMKGATTHSSAMAYQTRLTYLEVPALVSYQVTPRKSKDRPAIDLVFGAVFDLNLGASEENTGTKSTQSLRDSVRRVDIGLMLGGDVELVKNRLDLGVRFEIGLLPVFNVPNNREKNSQLLIVITPRIFKD